MSRAPRREIPRRLIVCEGAEDKAFLERLIEARGAPISYLDYAGGNTAFSSAINRFRVGRTKEFNGLRNIVIVADNDDAPKDKFDNVREQINRVFGAGAAPDAPLVRTRRTATLGASIRVIMVPWVGIKGCLECMCIEAARSAAPKIGADIEHFLSVVHADTWDSENRRGKAWLRTNLAVRCERDPFVALGHVFSDPHNHALIPMAHPSFNKIADELMKD